MAGYKDHKVEAGDYMAQIAWKEGAADWKAVYQGSQNAEFRKANPDPDFLKPGTIVAIPEPAKKTEKEATEKTHEHEMTTPRVKLLLSVSRPYVDGKIKSDYVYEAASVAGGVRTVLKGHDNKAVPGSGQIEIELPVSVEQLQFTLWAPKKVKANIEFIWTLGIGHLQPVETLIGLIARLNHLWFYAGPMREPKTEDEEKTLKTAIRCFQRRYGLKPADGDYKDDTKRKALGKKLTEIYGC